MKKQYSILSIFILILLVIVSGCKKSKEEPADNNNDDDNNNNGGSTEVKFSITGAKAIIFDLNTGNKLAGDEPTSATLLKMDENGTITSAVEGMTVYEFKKVPGGLYVSSLEGKRYLVKSDNTYQEIVLNSTYADYKGYNTAGDIIFSDMSVFRAANSTVEKISSSLSGPSIQSVSGDYAVISSSSTAQILNTITGVRYNIASCNGPRVFDLGSEKAFIDDCSSQAIMDFSTGNRSAGDANMVNGEVVLLPTGGIVTCSQGMNSISGYSLAKINDAGTVSSLSSDTYTIGSSACMNCGAENEVLFNTGDYYVVKESGQVSLFKIGDANKTAIMAGYNIISVSLKDNKIYFLAETTTGDPKSGIYDLASGNYTLSNSTSYYDEILAF